MSESTPSDQHVATYNLRYDSKPDNISVAQTIASLPDPLKQPNYLSVKGEQPWSTRRIRVAQKILSRKVDIFCVQEALVRQVHDLQELLGDDWAWEGVGRDDGKEAGEFSAVFYQRARLRVETVDYFWLSQTPFEPSKYPGAGSIRICTAIRFLFTQDSSQEQPFVLLNTHLDDQSDAQRRLGASMLLVRAQYEAVKFGPVLLTGDFNSPPTGSDSGAYSITTGATPPVSVPTDFAGRYSLSTGDPRAKLIDFRASAPREYVVGGFATFTGFNAVNDTSAWARIDFIFGSSLDSQRSWSAQAYEVDTAVDDDGVLASDHRPVFVHVVLSTGA